MWLLDTSAWIEVFRKKDPFDLKSVGGLDEVVTCFPVMQEVLQGFRDESAYRTARDAMRALPCVESPIPLDRFDEAATLYRGARRAGLTVRSGTDCLIAVCAIRHGLSVLHRDRDFTALARVSPLIERNIGR
ncbi:MAG: PIN domain-containing protein [Vicinamibacteria bacterium]